MAGGTAEPTAVVTGASSGIGLYVALGLARAGMRVVMVGRDPARTEAARRFVLARSPGAPVKVALADFAALAEVRRLADEILAAHDRIGVLVNNAGLFSPGHRVSADGFELTFAVNHLAPFLLTNLLLDRLRASAPARIVTVASEAHRGQRLDPALLAYPPDRSAMRAYGRSKLCNILFTRELALRLAGSGVVAACFASRRRRHRDRPAGRPFRARLAADEALHAEPRTGGGDLAVPGDGARPGAVSRRLCRSARPWRSPIRRHATTPSPAACGRRARVSSACPSPRPKPISDFSICD